MWTNDSWLLCVTCDVRDFSKNDGFHMQQYSLVFGLCGHIIVPYDEMLSSKDFLKSMEYGSYALSLIVYLIHPSQYFSVPHSIDHSTNELEA